MIEKVGEDHLLKKAKHWLQRIMVISSLTFALSGCKPLQSSGGIAHYTWDGRISTDTLTDPDPKGSEELLSWINTKHPNREYNSTLVYSNRVLHTSDQIASAFGYSDGYRNSSIIGPLYPLDPFRENIVSIVEEKNSGNHTDSIIGINRLKVFPTRIIDSFQPKRQFLTEDGLIIKQVLCNTNHGYVESKITNTKRLMELFYYSMDIIPGKYDTLKIYLESVYGDIRYDSLGIEKTIKPDYPLHHGLEVYNGREKYPSYITQRDRQTTSLVANYLSQLGHEDSLVVHQNNIRNVFFTGHQGIIDSVFSHKRIGKNWYDMPTSLSDIFLENSLSGPDYRFDKIDSLYSERERSLLIGEAYKSLFIDPAKTRLELVDSLRYEAERMQSTVRQVNFINNQINNLAICECPIHIEVFTYPTKQIYNYAGMSDSLKPKKVLDIKFDPNQRRSSENAKRDVIKAIEQQWNTFITQFNASTIAGSPYYGQGYYIVQSRIVDHGREGEKDVEREIGDKHEH